MVLKEWMVDNGLEDGTRISIRDEGRDMFPVIAMFAAGYDGGFSDADGPLAPYLEHEVESIDISDDGKHATVRIR